MRKSGTKAKAYLVNLNVAVVVWPFEMGYPENADGAQEEAKTIVFNQIYDAIDVRILSCTASGAVKRYPDLDLVE